MTSSCQNSLKKKSVIVIINNRELTAIDVLIFTYVKSMGKWIVFSQHEGLQRSNPLNSSGTEGRRRMGVGAGPPIPNLTFSWSVLCNKYLQVGSKNCLFIRAVVRIFPCSKGPFHISLWFYRFDDKLTVCHFEIAPTMSEKQRAKLTGTQVIGPSGRTITVIEKGGTRTWRVLMDWQHQGESDR